MGSDRSVGKFNSKYAKIRIFQAIIKSRLLAGCQRYRNVTLQEVFILSMGSDRSVGKFNSKYAKVRIFQAIIKSRLLAGC